MRAPAPRAPRLVLVCGLPGAGKSTYARGLVARGFRRFTVDAEAFALGYRDAADIPAAVADGIRRRQREQVAVALAAGEDVVVDQLLWSRGQRAAYREVGRAAGAEVTVVHVTAPEHVLRERLAARCGAHPDDFAVGDPFLAWVLDRFRPPGPDETDVTTVSTG